MPAQPELSVCYLRVLKSNSILEKSRNSEYLFLLERHFLLKLRNTEPEANAYFNDRNILLHHAFLPCRAQEPLRLCCVLAFFIVFESLQSIPFVNCLG